MLWVSIPAEVVQEGCPACELQAATGCRLTAIPFLVSAVT